MDNASIHKSPQVRELIEEACHFCKYLPPYSPFLNPIEECWSKIKSTFKRTRLEQNESMRARLMDAFRS
ncbi:hypothetical protein BGZ80_009079, partial [Entomortierella chlamydospora]